MTQAIKIELKDLPFANAIAEAGGKLYAVGGTVRDNILGRDSKDLDILVTGIPVDKLETILLKFGRVDNVGKSFGIIKFNSSVTGEVDVAIPRTERKNASGGHRGFDVTSDHTFPIEVDLERRDFTINAIAKDINGLIIDPFGGRNDIEKRQIKMVNPQAFSDDPLRMLRAIQFAARFCFEIESNTMDEIQKNADQIKSEPFERIITEFTKIVEKGDPMIGALLLRQSGLYAKIFGVDTGINFANFSNVKTLGEFIFGLIRNAIPKPAEFFKEKMKGDIDTYREIKALELGGEFDGDMRTIYEMYKVFPNSVNTRIFGRAFEHTVETMESKNIPFSLKEVPVNGNDLIELGFEGKEIGVIFRDIIDKIYKETLLNERDAILKHVKNNYKAIDMIR